MFSLILLLDLETPGEVDILSLPPSLTLSLFLTLTLSLSFTLTLPLSPQTTSTLVKIDLARL